MTATLLLLASAVVAGLLVGAVGIGGVLLVPILVVCARLPVHDAGATALFSFIFTGLAGGWAFHRRGTIDWRVAGPVSAAAFSTSFAGAAAAGRVPAAALTWVVAAVLFGAGLYCLFPDRRGNVDRDGRRDRRPLAPLLGIGALSGFGAGLSGAGGPLFSIPLMLALRFDPLAAVATGQIVQVASALSASLRNARHETIHYGTGVTVAIAQLIGTFVGVRIAHAARSYHLRLLVAILCIASAVAMAVKAML